MGRAGKHAPRPVTAPFCAPQPPHAHTHTYTHPIVCDPMSHLPGTWWQLGALPPPSLLILAALLASTQAPPSATRLTPQQTSSRMPSSSSGTTPSHGIPSSPDGRRQLPLGKDRGRVQHFVPYAEVLIAFGPSVPCSTFSHLLVGPHLLILSQAPSGPSVCPGTRAHASSPPAAPIGTYVLPISLSARQKNAPAHPESSIHISAQTNDRL